MKSDKMGNMPKSSKDMPKGHEHMTPKEHAEAMEKMHKKVGKKK